MESGSILRVKGIKINRRSCMPSVWTLVKGALFEAAQIKPENCNLAVFLFFRRTRLELVSPVDETKVLN